MPDWLGPVLIVAFFALLIFLWAHPQWFAPTPPSDESTNDSSEEL